jgi:hypothetical protein
MLDIFPCQFVYYTQVENHLELKEKYLSKILDDMEANKTLYGTLNTWKCNVISSFFSDKGKNLMMFGDEFYNQVVWNPLRSLKSEMAKTISLYQFPKKIKLSEIWYNAYDSKLYQEYHNHGTSNFSGIYLFDLNETNKTVFKQDKMPSMCLDKYCLYDTSHIGEGNVIIFPSDLSHCVKPCETNRITISFNLRITE